MDSTGVSNILYYVILTVWSNFQLLSMVADEVDSGCGIDGSDEGNTTDGEFI